MARSILRLVSTPVSPPPPPDPPMPPFGGPPSPPPSPGGPLGPRGSNDPLDFLYKTYKNIVKSIAPNTSDPGDPNLRGLTQEQYDILTRNVSTPLTEEVAQNIYGTADEQLRTYAEFQEQYKFAIRREIENNGRKFFLSEERKRELFQALDSEDARINLNLISDLTERRTLQAFVNNEVLKMRELITEVGVPGLYTPSSNINRLAGRMMVDTRASTMPILDLLQQVTFSVDPYQEGFDTQTIKVGGSLPSLSELTRISQGEGRMSSLTPGLSNTGISRFVVLDTESTGVTNLDVVRSISAQEMTMQTDAAGQTRLLSSGENMRSKI